MVKRRRARPETSRRARWQTDAGFQLGAMSGEDEDWSWFRARKVLSRMLHRMVVLAEGHFGLDLALHASGGGDHVIASVCGRRRTLHLAGPDDERTVKDGLAPLLSALNEILREEGLSHRFAVSSAPKLFGCHVHLVPRADGAAFFGALDLAPEEASKLPRIARLHELVPRSRLYESDFKCPARPSDIASLVEEIAAFGGVSELRVGLGPTPDGDAFEVTVVDGRRRATAIIEDRKYVDVRPVLPLFDQALARREAPHRMLRCYGDGFEDAIARVTEEEAARLARLSFLENPYELLAATSTASDRR